MKIKKKILQVTPYPTSASLSLNTYLNNKNYFCDYLSIYPDYKIKIKENKYKRNTNIKKQIFFEIISSFYIFLVKYQDYFLISKIYNIIQHIAYNITTHYILKNKDKYDVFIIQASLASDCLKYLNNKICILDKPSAHVLDEINFYNKEFKKRKNEKITKNNFIYKNELKEYELVNFIVVPSKYVYKSFINRGFPDTKIKLIPFSGYDNKIFYQHKNPSDDNFNILYVGRVNLEKGIFYLLEAFNELKLKKKKLTIVGQLSKNTKNIIKQFIKDEKKNIKIYNHVSRKNLRKIYSQGNVLVLPSLSDGWGMVATEALACGCPVICTKNSGVSDIIKNGINGYIIPIMNYREIINSLNKIYYKKIFKNRKKISKTILINKNWKKYLQQYEKLIKSV